MHLLAISRDPRFSKSEADKAILCAVVACLEQKGHSVDVVSEPDFQGIDVDEVKADLIFGMYRDEPTLDRLDTLMQKGMPCVPSPNAVRNARRENHINLLSEAGIPMPTSGSVGFPCWLKKASGWTEKADDVIFCEHEFPSQVCLADYIIQQHIEGDLVKFYGVEGTPFFHCHSQSATHYDFNPDTLRLIAGRASATLRLPIYGGDAIVTPEGAIFVIDFNDWPSFSTCRPQAATAIAQRLLSSVNPCH